LTRWKRSNRIGPDLVPFGPWPDLHNPIWNNFRPSLLSYLDYNWTHRLSPGIIPRNIKGFTTTIMARLGFRRCGDSDVMVAGNPCPDMLARGIHSHKLVGCRCKHHLYSLSTATEYPTTAGSTLPSTRSQDGLFSCLSVVTL
jgi:hypothetical protein